MCTSAQCNGFILELIFTFQPVSLSAALALASPVLFLVAFCGSRTLPVLQSALRSSFSLTDALDLPV